LLVGSDQERPLLQELAEASGGLCVAGQTDLPTLAALISESAGFIGNDSGPMHLAAAVGVPTLGVFGSTSPTWTAPRGPRALAVGPAPVHCSPCFRRRCPYELQCLRDLRVDTVWSALEEMKLRPKAREDLRA
jgi:heptosyltransferase-2